MEDAYKKISDWVEEYNYFRPHSSLNGKTPAEVVEEEQTKPCGEKKKKSLLAAPVSETMYFAAAQTTSALPENTYLHKQVFIPSIGPNSPT